MTTPSKPTRLKKTGGKDRAVSVGDFLLEVDEILRPLIDLSALLEKKHCTDPSNPCVIPYVDIHDAYRAQCRLRLLLQDGKDIDIGRAMNPQTDEAFWALNVPQKLFVRPDGGQAEGPNILDRVEWFQQRREAIAELVSLGKLAAASKARDHLWKDLSQLGLVVTIPEEDLVRLMDRYEKLPGLHEVGDAEAQLLQLLPYVQNLVDQSGPQKGELGAPTLPESEFIRTVEKISNEIFRQRHQIGRSENPADSRCYFPDDFTALLKAGLERGLGKGRLDLPAALFMPRPAPYLASIYTGAPKDVEGRVISRLRAPATKEKF